jgi:subtilisin family serine protease
VFLGGLQPNPAQRAAQASFEGATAHSSTAKADSADRVEAIVTLRGQSIAGMLNATASSAQRHGKIDLESEQARSHARQLQSQQTDFISRAVRMAPGIRVKGQLSVLANAISVELQRAEIPLISELAGVQSVEIARICHASLNRSVPLISAPAMWERLGGPPSAGAGIKIAIVDTGIDISSPLMSDQGMTAPPGFPRGNTAFTNNKVIVAKIFLPSSDATPADVFGHGTAVAGVAAGSLNTPTIVGAISGVAPRAYLGNYRVLDENGNGSEFQVSAGLEEAVKDGFDVANISLGVRSSGTLSLLGNAVEKAVASGMIVVAAAGNRGADGQQTIDSPAEAPSAIAVAASGNQHSVTAGLIVAGPGPLPGGLGTEAGTLACCGDLIRAIGPLPCMDISSIDPVHDGCNGLAAGSLSGEIALLQNSRSDCPMLQKLNAARAAGAAGAVVFSLDSTVGTTPNDLAPSGLPAILLGTDQGRALRSWVRQHPGAPVTISPAVEIPNDPDTDVWQSFSSLGPSGLAQLKPDIAAPGANIFTASSTATLGFELMSGTSLATPHIAGAAALVRQLHPTWAPDQVKSALMSSADPVFATSKRTDLAGALAGGAGRVNLDRAGSVTATFSPASLSFGFKKLKPRSAITPAVASFKITNVTATTGVYSISGSPDDASLSIAVSDNSITLAPNESATVTVTIIVLARKAANNQDHTGSVSIQDPGGQSMHIPYWVRFGDVKGASN